MATSRRGFIGYVVSAGQSEAQQQRSPWKRRPDGTACVDELLMSLSFIKTERNFRSGSSVCKQTQEVQGKEDRKGGRAASTRI